MEIVLFIGVEVELVLFVGVRVEIILLIVVEVENRLYWSRSGLKGFEV